MQPFFARVGGKTKLAGKIVKLFPAHDTYVEPFVGGGSVFFKKEKGSHEIINDVDSGIIHMYKDIMKVSKEDLDAMNFSPSKALFDKLEKLNTDVPKTRLYKNLYLSGNSFSGNRKSYADRLTGKGYKHLKANLEKYQNRLEGVKVINTDFKRVIKAYDGKQTLFYLDPPYSSGDSNWGYNENVSPEDVYNAVKNIKGKFILSYDNAPEIRKIFKEFTIKRVKTTYKMSAHNNNEAVWELLIMNF